MEDRTPDPLWVVLTEEVGIRQAFKVLLFVAQWGYVYEYMRGPVRSVEEYARFWRVHERFAYRQQKLFREAIGDGNPNRLWEQLRVLNPAQAELDVLIRQIRGLDLATPRKTPPDVEQLAARLGTLCPAI